MKVFPDYQEEVLQYLRSKEVISSTLTQPTPAGLRDECYLVCSERFNKKDEHILRLFFGKAEDANQYLKLIEKCDIDRLKPLANFLKNTAIKTNTRNIELLAWLIDFKHRPYDHWKEHSDEANKPIPSPPSGDNPPPPKPHPFGEKPAMDSIKSKGISFKKLSLYTGIILFITAGIYILYNSNKTTVDTPLVTGKTLNDPQACMYWAGDHYEQVSCNEKKESLVIALDSFKLQHFRKITRPDTITQNHVGSVWYIKNGGDIEFYTAEGMHPVDIKKRLKPATAYIIDKYIISRTD